MLINGLSHTTFDVKSYDKDIQPITITNFADWLRQAPKYLLAGQKETYINIKVRFFIRATDEQTAMQDISNLITQLESCTIQFDGLNFYYDCYMDGQAQTTHHSKTEKELEVQLKSSYAYQSAVTVTANSVSSININVAGNLPTYPTVVITPTVSLVSLTVGSMTINNLTANQPVTIQGSTVMQGATNKYGDFSGTFLKLNPGNNLINISSINCSVQFTYNPQWR